MPRITIVSQPSGATVVSDTVGPLEALSVVGGAHNLTDFFDSGFNAAPTVVPPAGGIVRVTAGPGAGVHFVNPA